MPIMMQCSAWTPEQFWMLAQVEEGKEDLLKAQGWIERPLSETEAARMKDALAKGFVEICLGDIADKYANQVVRREEGYAVELEPGKFWFWGVGKGTVIRDNARVYLHRCNAEAAMESMKEQYPEAVVVRVMATRDRMEELQDRRLV